MHSINKDVISGAVLALFSALLYLVIIPAQVEYNEAGPIALSPRLFCQITAILLLILSVSLVVIGLRAKPEDGEATGDDRASGLAGG